jgi:hypothetical protein
VTRSDCALDGAVVHLSTVTSARTGARMLVAGANDGALAFLDGA